VAASDTISRAILGTRGAILEIINGNASDDEMTISDSGLTPAGSPLSGSAYDVTVDDGTSKAFLISPKQVNITTGVVTVTHSVTSDVTYKLYPLG
jgi:hypothetical protein